MAAGLGGVNYLDLGNNLPIVRAVTAWTMMAWVHPTSFPTDLRVISISVGTGTGTRASLSISSTGRIEGIARTADGDVAVSDANTATGVVALNTWYHLAVVCDLIAQQFLFYRNGAPVARNTQNWTFALASATSDTDAQNGAIGALPDGSGEVFQGDIEDARIYTRLMGPDEIQSIYTRRTTGPIQLPGLNAHYPLVDGFVGPGFSQGQFQSAGQILDFSANVSPIVLPPARAATVESNIFYTYGVTKRRKLIQRAA